MSTGQPSEKGERRAALWETAEDNQVQCSLCSHRCLIKPDKLGTCHVRVNRGGVLYTKTYGRLVSANIDPIEKKPLFHFHPGSRSMSIATVGCNFRCLYCQNCSIAHWPANHGDVPLPGEYTEPEEVADISVRRRCASISYTYTEPTIFMEYARDVAEVASKNGIKGVFVTNGFMTREALDFIGDGLHAANVDLKTMDPEVMKRLSGGKVEPVLENIAEMRRRGMWVEVTTLVVPQLNDSDDELKRIANFLVETDPDIPWHLSRFHPDNRMMDRGATPPATLARACEIGRGMGIRYVYTGNLWGDDNESTRCPSCSEVVIQRYGFSVRRTELKESCCGFCGHKIAGVGLP